MPGQAIVSLKAGQTTFYNNNILHVGKVSAMNQVAQSRLVCRSGEGMGWAKRIISAMDSAHPDRS